MGKDSCRDGKWIRASIFVHRQEDENGAADFFETSQDKVTTPTFGLLFSRTHPTLKSGIIKRIHYRLNPTNAVTYILRLWRATAVAPYRLNALMLYESPAAQVDDADYDRGELEIPFTLGFPGMIYYSIEWTGASGNTPGFIDVSGEKVE